MRALLCRQRTGAAPASLASRTGPSAEGNTSHGEAQVSPAWTLIRLSLRAKSFRENSGAFCSYKKNLTLPYCAFLPGHCAITKNVKATVTIAIGETESVTKVYVVLPWVKSKRVGGGRRTQLHV